MGVKLWRLMWSMALVAILLIPLSAHAESIQSLNSDINISQDGVASFTEQISYVFDGQKHGIFRDVPYVSELPDSKYLYYKFILDGVERNGATESVSQSQVGVYWRLKIGTSDKTVSGTQNYTIRYSLSPVVRKDAAGDYITLNLYGTDWDIGADMVRGTVTLPDGAKILDAECFTGSQGLRDKNCSATMVGENSVGVASTQHLNAKEGMTLDLVVAPGTFTEAAYLTPSDEPPAVEDKMSPRAIAMVIFSFAILPSALMVSGIVILRRYLKRRARRRQETIVAQYDAPKNMSPGEVGLITDEVSSAVEVTATLIDLARRGYLTISYEKQRRLIGAKDRFLLTKLKTTDQLLMHELTLLAGIFVDKDIVYVDELDPSSTAGAVSLFKKQLESKLKTDGLFAQKQKLLSPDNLTDRGYDVWAYVEGLKLYLNVAEKDRIKFDQAPAKTPDHFTKLLPYAIALGVEKQWAKQFEGIDVESATRNWYHGPMGSNPTLFVGLMSNSFATSVTAHTTPPSSSGGAGGGFSGGGAGGGGGGSW